MAQIWIYPTCGWPYKQTHKTPKPMGRKKVYELTCCTKGKWLKATWRTKWIQSCAPLALGSQPSPTELIRGTVNANRWIRKGNTSSTRNSAGHRWVSGDKGHALERNLKTHVMMKSLASFNGVLSKNGTAMDPQNVYSTVMFCVEPSTLLMIWSIQKYPQLSEPKSHEYPYVNVHKNPI